ncbi:U3 snoRNP protein Utp20 [Massarina eburnea CBS 473.64]|uniref:U3 snoRNP protein Utp20 n=1 Tax=Massarina eburnea CBS 473.64 TaxID=1395130 RepID=A0A6A6S175_9PLEO|nr:U3 snoRNP protein Utp20 [Massarina eburnea CBS 473.64]
MRAPKNVKTGTASSRVRHRFQSFSDRIAKLKIEPVRRGRGTFLDDAELTSTFSYFGDALGEWRELNLSDDFSRFARRATPLCASLPQVLHHSDRLLALLVEHIERGDKHSEEPLLSLLAHLAHDLGVKFEAHFERAVTTVAQLAAKHPDVEVIEWSFTCLAWLFKYLSRLLVPDLRPVFDLMAPLLGKEHQKSFVTRFASDSLSFLVRKAGAVWHRDQAPLKTIVKHISEQLKELQGSGKDQEFQQGLMSLFAESMKGVQRRLHSSAVAVVEELLEATYDDDYKHFRTPPLQPVVEGAIISVIHHSDAENFQPVLDAVLAFVRKRAADARCLGISARLIFVVCGVRLGSRIADWRPALEALELLLDALDQSPVLDPQPLREYLSATSVTFQYCPLDAAIPHTRLLEKLCAGQLEKHFLYFCQIFAGLGPERFGTLLLPFFKRYVSQKAHEYGDELCLTLPNLHRSGAISASQMQCSSLWQDHIVQQFATIDGSEQSSCDPVRISNECNSILHAMESLMLAQEKKQEVATHLHSALKKALRVSNRTYARPIDILAAGSGFCFLAQDGDFKNNLFELWPLLCSASAVYGHTLAFWSGLLALADAGKSILDFQGPHTDTLKRGLMKCLQSSSHDMRLTALYLLKMVIPNEGPLQDAIATATLIEQTPVSLETQRSISMRVGQLATIYSGIASDGWVGEVVPTFCFGLLHVKLSSVWNDACSALKVICETSEGEAHVSRLALQWITEIESEGLPPSQPSETRPSPRYGTEFQCTNIMRLENIFLKSQGLVENIGEQLQTQFDAEHAALPIITAFSRTQALRLLNDLPNIAEKRSRLLVPVLLDWTSEQRATCLTDDDVTIEETSEPHRWSRKDQKAMLSVFSKFGNPKVLYRSTEVYEALLVLLANGDVEIQKVALKAILNWKDPAITEYQENLFSLLDDARFRDEIAAFLDVGSESTLVKAEHRERLLPVLLRLLYGRVISGNRGLETKRKAVFQALTRYDGEAISQFLAISLGPLSNITIMPVETLDEKVLGEELMPPRRQVGMLTMLEDILGTLKTTFNPFFGQIINPILFCLIRASRELSKNTVSSDSDADQGVQTSLFKAIRQRSLSCIILLFESCPTVSWAVYSSLIVQELINPRIEPFPVETAQSVSGLLRLFSAWAKSLPTATFLVDYNPVILSKIIECLGVPSAKDEVKRFVLDDILRPLVSLAANTDDTTGEKMMRNKIHSDILQPYSNSILIHVGDLLRKSPSKELLESGVQTVAELAPHVVGSAESRSMLEISSFLLKQPPKRVNAFTKLGLLRIMHAFILRCDEADLAELFQVILDAICPLFSYFRDVASRTTLCDIVQDLSTYDDTLSPVASICHDLNAFSTSRLDEPDFERRSSAFDIVNGEGLSSFSLLQWKPIVFNMLYFIKDNEELSIRVNASLSLRRFIQASVKSDDFKGFVSAAIIPGIQHGVRESSELVRVEILAVLAQLVETYRDWDIVADLHVLSSEDEESSFYTNILHIQGHRRLRALRRLASHATQLQSRNIYHILLPLLEHFVFNKADDDSANSLAGETVNAISTLCQGLEWPQFRSLLKRYIGYLSKKEDMQKTMIKLLAGLMDALNKSGRAKGYVVTPSGEQQQPSHEVSATSTDVDMNMDVAMTTLSNTLPQQEKLTNDVIDNLLPGLTEFLRKKDESNVSLRVPISIAVTKVLLVLPPAQIEARLPAILLDVCHILRSRAQDGRDMARNTLSEIATFAGPAYLGFIIKALRLGLQRGYQLHVLSFTLHTILVKLTEQIQPGDLDYCLTDIVEIIMDDTFGLTGQEKDAEEYISKMKEVKSSKSFDSMDIIARCVTPSHLVDLILPIKSLLMEKINAKVVQKVDELLRRVGLGLLQNPTVNNRDILIFSYELFQEVYKVNNSKPDTQHIDPRNKKFLVNMKGASKSGARLSTSSYIYKLSRFSLDILRTVLRKHEELQTPQHLAGFLPILGDALVAGQEEVQVSAVRLLSTIIKVPMQELDENCPVYVTEAVRAIKGSPSSNTEISQASLKLITAVLRDRPNVEVKERHLADLLKRIRPDLDEPDRQGVTFGFLKAVMNRKVVITEVYEVMDKIATIMVTNHTKSARDLARSSYFHFLMEYPQAKNRFKRQVEFLLKNLRYDHVEGRQSVMEALNLMLSKVGDDVLQEELGMMFIPLIHSLANDDSNDCRTMAGALLKKVFERADAQRLKSFTVDLRSWLGQDEDMGMKRLGIQCWGLYLEVVDPKPKELEFVMEHLQTTLSQCLERRDDGDWELIYYSITVFAKLCKSLPDNMSSPDRQDLWDTLKSCVSYPHAWIKLTSAKLIGTYFADFASTNGDSGLDALPLKGSRGLCLTEDDMVKFCNAFLKNLENSNASEELCAQSVRNLAFLGRCFAANGAIWNWQKTNDSNDDADEDALDVEENGDVEMSEGEWGGFSPPAESMKPKQPERSPHTAIYRLITRLSGLIRRETRIMKLSSLHAKTATMTLLETLTNKLAISSLESSLPHLLTTLSTLTDPATTIPRSTDPTFNDTYRALIDKATEIMNILQKRMGTQEYLKVMSDVQKGVRHRREERKQKRRIDAVAAPEKWGKEKKRRNDVKKVKRKERNEEFRGKRRGW